MENSKKGKYSAKRLYLQIPAEYWQAEEKDKEAFLKEIIKRMQQLRDLDEEER
jgi:hypothetical protein